MGLERGFEGSAGAAALTRVGWANVQRAGARLCSRVKGRAAFHVKR